MKLLLVIPVYNEEARIAASVGRLARFLAPQSPGDCELIIADNGSTDRTLELSRQLQRQLPGVRVVHLEQKGRGRALKQVWLASEADILSYMDVDLSTDLAAWPGLIEPLAGGRYDLATGSRLASGSQTSRCWKREGISRAYNRLVKLTFHTHFSDAQCGFKAITRQAARELLPWVADTGWFFDTELLVLAEKRGYRILDLPVHWTENADSRVRILRTAWADLLGILRLRRNLFAGKYGPEV